MKSAFLKVAVAAVTACFALAAHAAYPEGPIKLIVPYAVGGGTDIFSRAFAEGLSRELKQPVVVENKTGAGAIVGTQAAASAPHDGYTLVLAANGNMVMTPILFKNLKYDAKKDFKILTLAAESPLVVLTHPKVPVNNLREFESYAKANTGKVFYGTLGFGNIIYGTTKFVESMMNIQMTPVPYKGSSHALAAIMGEEVQVYIDLASTSIPLVKTGKLKALAVPNNKRLEGLPDVPTFEEAGYPRFHAATFMGWAVGSKTPEPIVKVLQEAARKVVADPKFKETAKTLGFVVLPTMDDKATEDFVEADRKLWADIVKRYNITVEQ